MAERVDEKGALLDEEDAQHAREQEPAQGAGGPVPEPAQHGRQPQADEHRHQFVPPVLPHHEPVLAEIGDIVERRFGQGFEKNPADVRPEKPAADVVGIIVVIGVAVVAAMVRGPVEHGILERAGAEDERENAHRPFGFEGQMREQPVVAQRDAHARGEDVEQEHCRLEPIQPVVPQVDGGGDQCAHADDKEKNRVDPVNPVPGDIPFHSLCGLQTAEVPEPTEK